MVLSERSFFLEYPNIVLFISLIWFLHANVRAIAFKRNEKFLARLVDVHICIVHAEPLLDSTAFSYMRQNHNRTL